LSQLTAQARIAGARLAASLFVCPHFKWGNFSLRADPLGRNLAQQAPEQDFHQDAVAGVELDEL
jgi:hypothetical protein